jgi:N-acetylmuramoyl-L-alanine amidase
MTGMDTLLLESHPLSEQSPVCPTEICPAAKAVCPIFLRALFIIFGFYILLAVAAEAVAKQPLVEANKVIIVLDPGHGGNDSGAVGPDGTTEKAVALILAQMIATELAREYTVVFTRLDDYQVEIEKRPAVANHQKADLFISIHTGGSFVHSTTGATLYYYQHDSDRFLSRVQSSPPPAEDPHAPILWNLAQYPYLEDSRVLAKMIKAQIDNLNSIKPCRLEGAPLAVLKGANMPAILIEVGYLTNPAEEKTLRNTSYLLQIAAAISKGIEDFLSRNHQ